MTEQIRSTDIARMQTVAGVTTLPFVCTSCHEEVCSTRPPTFCSACHGDDFALARSPASELTFVADADRGWLIVAAERYGAYGLDLAQISGRSHIAPDGSVLALDEDHDAEAFLQAFRDRHGLVPYIAENFEDLCKTRTWPHFPPARQ